MYATTKPLFIISHFHRREAEEKQKLVEYKLRTVRPCVLIAMVIAYAMTHQIMKIEQCGR